MRLSLLALVLVVLEVHVAHACAMSAVVHKVNRTFRIVVMRTGGPAAGVPVRLWNKNTSMTQTADLNGIVSFSGVQSGEYTVETHGFEIPELNDEAFVEVSAKYSANQFELHYPAGEIVEAAELRGVIRLRDGLRPMKLIVRNPDGKTVFANEKFAGGAFDAHAEDPGLYSIILSGSDDGWYDGVLAVRLNPESPVRSLYLGVAGTSCGAYFANSCEFEKPIQASGACFRVVDSMDAVISKMTVSLDAADGSNAARAQSDSRGEIAFEVAPGTYDLSITGDGWPAVRRRVQIKNTECIKPVEIVLNLFGCTGVIKQDATQN